MGAKCRLEKENWSFTRSRLPTSILSGDTQLGRTNNSPGRNDIMD
jgi:hypothetical protein